MEECANLEGFLPLQQSPVYAAAAGAMGARLRWIDLGVGQALALERYRLRVVLRGPLWSGSPNQATCISAVRRLARWPGLTVVTPGEPLAGFGLVPLVTPSHHAIWDLSGDLRQGMSVKWRNRLTAALGQGVAVHPGDLLSLDHLVRAEARQRSLRRYRALPEAFTSALDPGALRLWEWRDGREIGAAMAFVVHGGSVSYHLGWASDAARKVGAHGVMLAQAAQALAAEGLRWLDLGLVDTQASPGLARFKLGTGAALHRLGATLMVLP
jgi:Acetyltransferase (GNAT) domain